MYEMDNITTKPITKQRTRAFGALTVIDVNHGDPINAFIKKISAI